MSDFIVSVILTLLVIPVVFLLFNRPETVDKILGTRERNGP